MFNAIFDQTANTASLPFNRRRSTCEIVNVCIELGPIRLYMPFPCSCDFDFDPMTLIYEVDRRILKM